MSDRLKSTHNVSNEDVIDDLTKDLRRTLSSSDGGHYVGGRGRGVEDFLRTSGDAGDESYSDDISLSDDDLDKHSKAGSDIGDSDISSMDDESLRDSEMELPDKEKEQRRTIAEDLKTAGNNAFKDADYEKSIDKYTEALFMCPLHFTQLRAILYCNRSAANIKLEDYKKAMEDCTKSIELDDKYVKAYYRRAQCYEGTDKLDESLAEYNRILEMDPSHKEAQNGIDRISALIETKNEELKAEMLGKLKDFGNLILKPFGLSTENFQLEQDPDSKGYKINFKQ